MVLREKRNLVAVGVGWLLRREGRLESDWRRNQDVLDSSALVRDVNRKTSSSSESILALNSDLRACLISSASCSKPSCVGCVLPGRGSLPLVVS